MGPRDKEDKDMNDGQALGAVHDQRAVRSVPGWIVISGVIYFTSAIALLHTLRPDVNP